MPFITQILLPKCDNLGQPFDDDHYTAFHARMIHKFGGWTRKGQAEGAWLSPSGQLYAEEHWVYEVGHPRRSLRSRPNRRGKSRSASRSSAIGQPSLDANGSRRFLSPPMLCVSIVGRNPRQAFL